jgi:axial budding pattern protein 2
MGPPTKPRLVPFTSSTRVPVPNPDGGGFTGNRIASQRAKVCKAEFKDEVEGSRINASATADELSMGLHYVRSLGADQLAVNNREGNGSSPALSNMRSSFTSLESSHVGYKSEDGLSVTRVLVRAGERFKFRIPISLLSAAGETCSIRLTSGQSLPKFIQSELSCVATKELLELSGLATFRDLGEFNIGIFKETDGACLARIVLEVVGKR